MSPREVISWLVVLAVAVLVVYLVFALVGRGA